MTAFLRCMCCLYHGRETDCEVGVSSPPGMDVLNSFGLDMWSGVSLGLCERLLLPTLRVAFREHEDAGEERLV